MVRRFITNCQVTLAVGYLLFFFSERLFWTVFKPGDRIFDLVITWLAYSVLGCVLLNIVNRFEAGTPSRLVLAGAIYGWLAEGALVGTLYGTEPSAPFPRSIVQTALSWHMLISVLVGFHFLTSAIRQCSIAKTALISAGIGLFWAAWSPFQWREIPPIILPVWAFAAHAVLTGALLALACTILSGDAMNRYKPGWFGLILSLLILAVFYSAQVKALGIRPLVVLPLLVAGVLALLWWAKPTIPPQPIDAPICSRWRCALAVFAMPLIATLGYAFQILIVTRGINPGFIFNGLAFVGIALFVAACAFLVRSRLWLSTSC
jgi:hypothetical protein